MSSQNAGSMESSAPKAEPSLNDRFFRHFQEEVTALQVKIDRLTLTPLVGGEQADAVDYCLAGISHLSNEVKDASSYIPAYDQRIYGEAIKALQDKLGETREIIAPRRKFAFKTARKNAAAVPSSVAPEDAAVSPSSASGRTLPPYHGSSQSLNEQKTVPLKDHNEENNASQDTPSTSTSGSTLSIASHFGIYLTLGVSDIYTNVPVSITSIQQSVIDMSKLTANGRSFAALTMKSLSKSVVICGHVNGAAHITAVDHSVIVVQCHQFRMHDCKNVDVFLHCSSKPIIEGCSNIRFSSIPPHYVEDDAASQNPNMWSEVQDFNWLKSEHSPNWSILGETDVIPDEVWAGISSGDQKWTLDKILKAMKIQNDELLTEEL
ncbi:hypothetical protein FQN57_004455 [Myotisia sp. PD_48]|nr:hypothetical protein FQN57_004455 [Myotisia sp. PD_48]